MLRRVLWSGLGLSVLVAPVALAERPPSSGKAAAALYAGLDGGPADTPGARFIATLKKENQAALRKNHAVVLDQVAAKGGPVMVKAVVLFDKPIDEVYATLGNPSAQSTFLPHVQESKSHGDRTEEGERIDYQLSMLFVFKFRTQHWYYPAQKRIEWKLDPTGPDGLAEQDGYWQFYELDDLTTVAEYGTHVSMKSALLDFFRTLGERGGVNDAIAATRKYVESRPAPK